jgi:hypothetical protein
MLYRPGLEYSANRFGKVLAVSVTWLAFDSVDTVMFGPAASVTASLSMFRDFTTWLLPICEDPMGLVSPPLETA